MKVEIISSKRQDAPSLATLFVFFCDPGSISVIADMHKKEAIRLNVCFVTLAVPLVT